MNPFILLGIYIASITGTFYSIRTLYIAGKTKKVAGPIFWVIPGLNTVLAILGLFLVVKDLPIVSSEFWQKRWDKVKTK